MRLSWLFFSLLVALAVFLAANLLVSSGSAEAYSALETHRDRLLANIQDLRSRQNELAARADLLARSSEAVRLEARRLQRYEEGAQVVRIEGYDTRSSILSPGRVLRGRPVATDRSGMVRTAAIAAGCITLVILVALGRRRSQSRAMRRTSR